MRDLDGRIVHLEPMLMASLQTFSGRPEEEGLVKLRAWAESKGLLDGLAQHRIFGFDLPAPAPDSPDRGYEFWIPVGPDVEAEGEVTMKEFAGSMPSRAASWMEIRIIPPAWQRLIDRCEQIPYRTADHQWLEEHLDYTTWPQPFTLDLYLPIAESQ